MDKITVHAGTAVPLRRSNVDTDQIIPAVYLKRISRTGFEDGLFSAWRDKEPDFVLNQAQYHGATILVAGPDFGTGSSREHAVWALIDYGFKAVIAPRFGDIFRGNSLKAGLLTVVLPEQAVRQLWDDIEADPAIEVIVDVVERQVRWASEGSLRPEHVAEGSLRPERDMVTHDFALDDYTRWRLMEGLDDIAITLRHTDDVESYENDRRPWLPTATV
ncbi:MAG: 3-isopropylmalate dehydratase small subunit [Actinomycetota bacterium]|nr:3-isopropylmalate dehydratase small subunit [Actinomycetota bacterium]